MYLILCTFVFSCVCVFVKRQTVLITVWQFVFLLHSCICYFMYLYFTIKTFKRTGQGWGTLCFCCILVFVILCICILRRKTISFDDFQEDRARMWQFSGTSRPVFGFPRALQCPPSPTRLTVPPCYMTVPCTGPTNGPVTKVHIWTLKLQCPSSIPVLLIISILQHLKVPTRLVTPHHGAILRCPELVPGSCC